MWEIILWSKADVVSNSAYLIVKCDSILHSQGFKKILLVKLF